MSELASESSAPRIDLIEVPATSQWPRIDNRLLASPATLTAAADLTASLSSA